jgi:hypothetical protein
MWEIKVENLERKYLKIKRMEWEWKYGRNKKVWLVEVKKNKKIFGKD